MRYKEGLHVYSMDDIINFDECALINFIQDQDNIQSKTYLRQKITELSESYPGYKDGLNSLLRALNDNNQELFKSLYLRFLDAAVSNEPDGIKKIVISGDGLVSKPSAKLRLFYLLVQDVENTRGFMVSIWCMWLI
jgi:trans-aconitate methyltransferase